MSSCFVEKCVDVAVTQQRIHRATWVSGNGGNIGPPFSRNAIRLSVVGKIREHNDWPKSRNTKPCPACNGPLKFKTCCGKTPARVTEEDMYDGDDSGQDSEVLHQTPRFRFDSDGPDGSER